MLDRAELLGLFPEILLWDTTLILLVLGMMVARTPARPAAPFVRTVAWLGLHCVLLAIVLVGVGIPITINSIHDILLTDSFTHCCDIFLLVGTAGTIMLIVDHGGRDTLRAFETIVLILLSTSGMLVLISASDLLIMFIAMELQTLCFYVLAASKRDSECSTEAGLKYFLLGAFSSGLFLFGCSMVYGSTGVTNFEELGILALTRSWGVPDPSTGIPIIGILCIVVGFLFKITAVPFHMWAPDVYEGSLTLVTAFFSIAPKIAIFANMVRVLNHCFHDHDWQSLLFFASIGSMILGTVAAMAQQKVKRFVVYSSIGHVGYLCIGFAGGTTMEGIQSLLIGLLIYLFMTVNVFGLFCAVRPVRSQYLGDLGVFGKLHPLFAITFSLTMFSYAGIPPLAGFCSKFYLFFGAIRCGADVLAGLGVVTSVISCFYYLRLVKLMYFDLPGEYMIPPRLDRDNSIVLAITVACITLMFLYTSPLFLVTHYMAMGLFAESGVGFSGSVA
uniref:NADH dehydrogenase subunit 2 n=1 Tax=Selaginella moellendorffii TaxID=88036 RepID=F2YI90_SELML|nr:NADH dehydrogenase subunit 2 [Selaginella moellendorffii]AEA29868.1 NADH dehydrogenase subunit 2 [Selaginella moellendorffii]